MHWDITKEGAYRGPVLRELSVLLDGVEQRRVREFDTERGYVRVLLENEQGQPYLLPDGETVAEEERYGVVTVHPHTDRAAAFLRQVETGAP